MVYHILQEELLLQIEWATLIHLDMTVHLQCILPCKYKYDLESRLFEPHVAFRYFQYVRNSVSFPCPKKIADE